MSTKRGRAAIGAMVVALGSSIAGGAPALAQEQDLLDLVRERGEIRVSTDAAYPPQSELLPDGTLQGFDIDAANEIGERLGVKVTFVPTDWLLVDAGTWAERWDISVGSMTITQERLDRFSFSSPYNYTPAQMGATTASGITSLDQLAGKTICTGEATTYQFWIQGTLTLIDAPPLAPVPEGVKLTTFTTDTICAEAVLSGRTEFEAWLTSAPTLYKAIADGAPFVPIGDPVFYEALGVSIDKAGPPHAALQAEIARIVDEMHADGTLTELSLKWFTDAKGDPVDYTTVVTPSAE